MAANKPKFGLGKGLGALLPANDKIESNQKISSEIFDMIDISKIILNPYQPRKEFDPQSLEELSESIKKYGLIQPITCRKVNSNYELISGERRYRACKLAGLKQIPAYIIKVEEDVKMLEMALIENIQRVDLNPIETANGYQRLIEECGYTQEQVAERIGKDRSTITNFIRLLKLPEKVQDDLRDGLISVGHARTLLGLNDRNAILVVEQEIIKNNLNVRQVEKIVKDYQQGKIAVVDNAIVNLENKEKTERIANVKLFLNSFEDDLRQKFATKVSIKPKDENSGTIEINFFNKEEFERIINLLNQINPAKNNE